MKNVKKVFALMLAFAMVLAMSATVFAADPDYSITVTNGVKGETYSAYKMFDLSVDDPTNPEAYRYTLNEDWTAFADTDEFKAVYTIDAQGYITSDISGNNTWSATSDLSKVADAAAKFAKDHNITPKASKTADADGDVKLELGEAGYYVISSTLGSRAMIETTPDASAVTINEKNDMDTIEKTVKENSTGAYGSGNDAQVGDTVEFKSIVKIVPRSVNVKIHDTMDSGLSLNAASIKVYKDEALTDELTDAVIKTGTEADEGDTFTITIPDSFAATAEAEQNLYIIYTAELNAQAVANGTDGYTIVAQRNKTTVSFGAGTTSVDSTTTTTTHSFKVFKHKNGSNENLANAIFALKKDGTVINLIKLDDNNYRVADDTETGTPASHVGANGTVNEIAANSIVKDFVTVSSGDIVIWGVDSGDDYEIEEMQAPDGYNKLAKPVSVNVKADNSTREDVANNYGNELPSTGGIGTVIFYIVGAALVIGCGVVLISRRRVSGK